MTRASQQLAAAMKAGKRKNKFGAKKTVLDGRTFDSKAEAKFVAELRQREKAGEVGGVELQRPFPLMAPSGQIVGVYKADAAFWDHVADRFRVIDVKGHDTALSKWKRKHVKAQYGIEVEIVK
jgi:hypothetical protein